MNTKDLYEIIPDKERVITENISAEYLSDVLGRLKGTAQAVIKPVSTDEVSRVLKYAYENEIQVTPRGAGTNLVGSTVPDRGGITVSYTHLRAHET